MIPGSVKKLMEMSERERGLKRRSENEGKECCQACESEKGTDLLSRCKACEMVWYCDKVGSNEMFRIKG